MPENPETTIREDLAKLRRHIEAAYKIMGRALDTIQDITEVPDARVEEIREGIAAVAARARNLLGLERGE